jgi:hypothetical protein
MQAQRFGFKLSWSGCPHGRLSIGVLLALPAGEAQPTVEQAQFNPPRLCGLIGLQLPGLHAALVRSPGSTSPACGAPGAGLGLPVEQVQPPPTAQCRCSSGVSRPS